MVIKSRKEVIEEHSNKIAFTRDSWIKKNSYFYKDDVSYMRFLIHEKQKVLELGCGSGHLLNALNPSYGVGVDISRKMVEKASSNYPHLNFKKGDLEEKGFIESLVSEGPFDIIILSDTLGYLGDCEATFSNLQVLCKPDTRLVLADYTWFWEPILDIASKVGFKMPSIAMNWISVEDTKGFLHLSGFEVVKIEWRQLIPRSLFGIGTLINGSFGTLPLIRRLSLRYYIVARSLDNVGLDNPSVTIVVPCRNEKGNIEDVVKRIPPFCSDMEIIFVEGHSNDGTLDEINRVIKVNLDKDIKVLVQDGRGKGDAVRKGFNYARGDVLMILDTDLTVPPEDLPKFYNAIVSGKGEFINGTRLVYPMQDQAMRFLNFWANRIFSLLFSWLLNQRYTDTLCGTKVLTKKNYGRIASKREYFGEFDPFGDFDIIFGAAKLNLKSIEVPIRYAARQYGETQISRFRHGWLLLKMVLFAFRKLKVFR